MKKQILTALSLTLVAGALVFTSCKKSDDTSAPIVTVTGSTDVLSILNAAYTDPSATAKDDKDAAVTVTSDFSTVFNKDLAGTYKITYTATDAAGNVGTGVRFIEVYNEAKGFAKAYNVAGNQTTSGPGAGAYTYSDSISTSTTVNNRVTVLKYAGYSNAKVAFDINGTTVSIPSQTFLCGSPASNRALSGSGTVSATGVISISYTEVTNGSTAVGTLVYTKK